MMRQHCNDQSLLNEARTSVKKDTDLIIKCENDEKLATSRLLFALLLQPELRTELLTNENSYLVLQDVSQSDVKQFVENVFFHKGLVNDTFVQKFNFINWQLFRSSRTDTETEVVENVKGM